MMLARLLARLAELEAFVYEPQPEVVERLPEPNPFAVLGDDDLQLIVEVIDGEVQLAAVWDELSQVAGMAHFV
jgi:hypothetical protein